MGNKQKQISTRKGTDYLYTVLRILGIDNLNKTWLYLLYSFQLNLTSLVLQLIAFTTSYILTSAQMTVATFLTSLQVAINVYTIALKILVVYLSMERLRSTDIIFDKLDTRIQGPKERAVAEEMVKVGRRLIIFYMASYYTYSISTFLAAIINGHPPFAIYIPFCHWHESKTKMIIASFLEFYLINISCLQDVGLDAYPVTFIYLARMHMKILCIRVKQLGKDPTKSDEDNVKVLIECIDTHRTIIELIEVVRPVISKTVFLQFIVTAAVMGIILTNIMIFADLFSAIGSAFFLLAVTIETLPLCYTMNLLMDEINKLPNSILHSGWIDQSPTFRHMLVFFMQNAQKFNNIMAGDILPVEISTFISIAKLAFSIYALVNKMENRRHAHDA